MKSIYLRNLCVDIWKHKKVVFIFVIIFVLMFGALGLKEAKTVDEIQETSVEMQTYEKGLQEYDDVIANVEESIESEKEQVASLERYCEESIYMNIDPLNVQVASGRYAVQADSDANEKKVLYAYGESVKNGSIMEELQGKLEGVSDEYLKEIISYSISSNILSLSVVHYDMDTAQQILQKLDELLQNHKDEIAGAQCQFDINKLDTASYVNADVNMQSTQNDNLYSLNTHKNYLADREKKLVEYQTDRDKYVETYKPEDTGSPSTVKVLLKYVIFGIICGIVIPVVVLMLRYITSDRLKGREELLAAGISVLGNYGGRKGYVPSIDRTLIDLTMLAKQKNTNSLFFNMFGEDEYLQKVGDDYQSRLEEQGFQVDCGIAAAEDALQVQKMMKARNCVFVVEVGKTTYAQIEEQIQLCQRFEISVWGCIVIE